VNDSAPHRQLARDAERKAIVLLKNQGGVLPLTSTVGRLAVVGPSADDPIGLLGNYNGISSKQVTPLEGITRQFAKSKVRYALGAAHAATPALVASNARPPDGNGPGCWRSRITPISGPADDRRTEPRCIRFLMEGPL
jgi:beta-glucosidase